MVNVSALMSVYNGEKYIAETINSILNQSYQDFEFVIVDDGSTDGTLDVIKQFRDPRIKLYQLSHNHGVGAALNFGFSKTTGKYIAKVDADDISASERFEKQVQYLNANPDIMLATSWVNFFAQDQEVRKSDRYQKYVSRSMNETPYINESNIKERIYWSCCIVHSSMMCRREALNLFPYDPSLRNGEDYKLFYELNRKGYNIAIIPEVLVDVRVTLSSTSNIEMKQQHDVLFYIKRDEILCLLEDSSSNCFIWGAGSYGQDLLDRIHHHLPDLSVAGFIDSSKAKHGTVIKGLRVYDPASLKAGYDKVIIASTVGYKEIVNSLQEKGFRFLYDYFVY